ncbi:hypothetical protein CHUAL_003351 [Chamberlinius hualienensis]
MSSSPTSSHQNTSHSEVKEAMNCYARLLARYPHVVIAAVTILASTCIVIFLTMKKLPNFQDPQMGFEPRGTVLAQRESAWNNLMEATKSSGPLTTNPSEEELRRFHEMRYNRSLAKQSKQRLLFINSSEKSDENVLTPPFQVGVGKMSISNVSDQGENLTILTVPSQHMVDLDKFDEIREITGMGSSREESEHILSNDSVDGFFCGEPKGDYSHMVFRSVDGGDLFTVKALRSMCTLEEFVLRTVPDFQDLCETNHLGQCCRSWSVGNYVALLQNKSSCHVITTADVDAVAILLRSCVKYYYNFQLQSDCAEKICRNVPPACYRHNAVYNMFHYLMDTKFLNLNINNDNNNDNNFNNEKLTYAMVFLPVACSKAALPYFKKLEKTVLNDEFTQIIAMELGLKDILFDECLITDTIFIGLAGVVILLFMWMYTNSFFITIMTVIANAFSLSIAYFLYTLIFKIKFFPFMNLLTAIIIIGIGADDAFIYCKVWACAKSEKNNGTLVKLMNDTLQHASLSMFVTSLTTAAAFYASYVSSITAIRCFSVFAGTTVLANFFLSITWVPATVIIAEKWCSSNSCICIPPFGLYAPQLQRHQYCSQFCNLLWKLHYRFSEWSRVFFEKILPCIVIKSRYVWVTLLGAVAVGGILIVFYYPQLHLPDSSEFQIFASDHPFEQYDLVFKDMFWFERMKKVDTLSKLPIRVVWGIKPVDNGNYMDPLDKGSLEFDESFNVAAPGSQKWLLRFCRHLRNQTFYQSMLGPLLPNCFIETFKSWMDRRCVDTISKRDRSPCCEKSKFPYKEEVFNYCIKKAMKNLYETPAVYFFPGVAGPRFSKETGRISALVIEYDSKYSFTFSYKEMNEFVTQVEQWVNSQMATAPEGMRNGWFISYLGTYELQDSLARGTIVAIGVAMGISLLVLFLTTLNVLITFYAILTIACIIFVTVAALVLLDWKLNMLESVTVSVAIGLAVDFTLHYGVVYRLSPEEDREMSVIYSIARMGSPIAMAAFTTFLAGLFMLPSSVLSYIQIGTFVMIVMTTSWIYSTLFFQSLLRLFGPQKHFGQFKYPSFNCCTPSVPHIDKTIYSYALSESTMSTSSIGFGPVQTNLNESHELEPLTLIGGTGGRISVLSSTTSSSGTGHRYLRHKNSLSHSSKGSRQRSGSLSVVSASYENARDSSYITNSRNSRKVSLPTESMERSPRHTSIATSSTTIVFSDEGDSSRIDAPLA